MNDLLHQAILLNNAAVSQLKDGWNLLSAVDTIQQGRDALKQAIDASDDDEDLLDTASAGAPSKVLIKVYQSFEDYTAVPSILAVKLEEKGAFFYGEPIQLDESFCATTTTNYNGFLAVTNQVAAVLLFNDALFHHLFSILHPRTEVQGSAADLYSMATKLLGSLVENHRVEADPSYNWPKVLMTLSLNNCAQIYHEEWLEYELSACLLDKADTFLSEDQELFQTTDLLTQEELTSLITNVTMLQQPSGAAQA